MFLPHVSSTEALCNLQCCAQEIGESITEFSERVQRLAAEAISAIKINHEGKDCSVMEAELSKQVIRTFKLGLRDPTVQDGIKTITGQPIQNLTDMARGIENFEVAKRRRQAELGVNPQFDLLNLLAKNKSQESISKGQSSEDILREILENQRRLLNTNLAKQPEQNRPFCNYCKRTGHSANECRSRPKCHKCGIMGHLASNCSVRDNSHQNGSYKPQNHGHNRYYSNKDQHRPPQWRNYNREGQGPPGDIAVANRKAQWNPTANGPPKPNVRYIQSDPDSGNFEGTGCSQHAGAFME